MEQTNSALLARSTSMKARKRIFALAVVVILCMAMFVIPFAAPDATSTIADGINAGMQKVYGVIKSITLPIAVIVFAFNAFKLFMGGQRGMEQAKVALITTVGVIFLIWFAPTIVSEAQSWFAGGSAWVTIPS